VLQEFLAVNYQRLRVIFPAYGMEASVHAQDDGAEEQLVARVITWRELSTQERETAEGLIRLDVPELGRVEFASS